MIVQQFSYSDSLIIIFAREPVAGKVKTRLIPALGADGAARLYQQLLDYTLSNTISAALAPVNLCITPESRKDYFNQLMLNHSAAAGSCELTEQQGQDLGIRMYHALTLALKKYSKAILIGTDCPFLSRADLKQAILALDANDMVFSPARDGGYVLVGAKKLVPEIFNNIEWGSERVMEQSRKALLANGVCWQELSEQYDIDVESDLKYLSQYNEFKEFNS